MPPKIDIEEFGTSNNPYEADYGDKWYQLNARYIQDEYGHRISELGEKFVEICELKSI